MRLHHFARLWSKQMPTLSARLSTSLVGGLLMLCTRCAVYDYAVDTTAAAASEADDGTAGSVVENSGGVAGASNSARGGRFYGGGGSVPGSVVSGSEPANGGSGSAVAGASGTNSAGQASAGGVSSVGGGSAVPDAGGSAGAAGSIADDNLSRGKATTTDSEQSHKFHYASDGNDGDRSTRWCALDWKPNHHWEVDLGGTFTLSALRVIWEQNAEYLFKVESSVDHTTWEMVLDNTMESSTAADQHYALAPGTTGRYVRMTVTGGLTPVRWASFYEMEVFGR
jgi:hypothetical protein